MKLIGTFEEKVAHELQEDGLILHEKILIGGREAYIFLNSRDVKIDKYSKQQIWLMNRMLFRQ